MRRSIGRPAVNRTATLHGEALRVALDRPTAWEYLLFATALRDGVARHRRLARTHALKLPIGFGEDVQDPLAWIQNRCSDARRLIKTLNDLFGAIQKAFGPAGTPGDTSAIVFVADTIADLYRDSLLWALRVRTANVGERFQRITTAVGDMMDDVVQQLAQFGPHVKAQIEAALAARPLTGVPIKITLTISLPESAMQSFENELARLTSDAQ